MSGNREPQINGIAHEDRSPYRYEHRGHCSLKRTEPSRRIAPKTERALQDTDTGRRPVSRCSELALLKMRDSDRMH